VENPWAPDISFFDREYHLYYSISTFGSQRSCIGLATNKSLDPASLDYRWTDEGKVVVSMPGRDDFNAIDPNLVLDERGQPWLSFGSFHGGIKIIRIDPRTGKPLPPDLNMVTIAARPGGGAVEAPFVVFRGGHYYLFVSFDHCCRGADSDYKIMVGRSRRVVGPYLDRAGVPMVRGGGTLVLSGHGRSPGTEAQLPPHAEEGRLLGPPLL
jgi:arabinan endo-1,5-alpha-L-arabinosidase